MNCPLCDAKILKVHQFSIGKAFECPNCAEHFLITLNGTILIWILNQGWIELKIPKRGFIFR